MPPKFDLDADLVRKLAKLLEETGLGEIEYAEGDKKFVVPLVSTQHLQRRCFRRPSHRCQHRQTNRHLPSLG
jgi:hypothetical protein